MALGAQRGQILRFFLGQGVRWAALGGVPVLAARSSWCGSCAVCFSRSAPYDPKNFLIVVAVLSAVVFWPARFLRFRATRVDPVVAMKSE